ncbi:AAA family ATPase [Komagataeibacter rhaeticus]|nr:AAA family ATPase [Komagataeibacter rhaeticus]
MLLIGEPGAGKSAVMNALGKELRSRGSDVVQLAVDRFSVESLEGVSRALRLDHDLPAVLDAWDGPDPAFLLIDALDASRGRSGEAAFKRLIESVIELGGRWTVVASIQNL